MAQQPPRSKAAAEEKRERKLRKKLGPALQWGDGRVDALAVIDDEALIHAQALWAQYAPDGWEGMLDARRVG